MNRLEIGGERLPMSAGRGSIKSSNHMAISRNDDRVHWDWLWVRLGSLRGMNLRSSHQENVTQDG